MLGFISCAYKTQKQCEAEALNRCALRSHLIYAGTNVSWDFLLIFLARLTCELSSSTCVSLYSLHDLGWAAGEVFWGSQSGHFSFSLMANSVQSELGPQPLHKSIWEYIISPLLPAFKGFGRFLLQPLSQLGWPDSLTNKLGVCMPLTQFSQNCSLSNIIIYLLGHRHCKYLPASDWALESSELKLRSPLFFMNAARLKFLAYTLLWAKWHKLFIGWRKCFHLWMRVVLPCHRTIGSQNHRIMTLSNYPAELWLDKNHFLWLLRVKFLL